MNLLFVARHFTYFRNFESAIRLLAEQGHTVHLAAERDESMGGRALVERLAATSPLVTIGHVPPRADERWFAIATVLRRSVDYLRYSASSYDDAPKIRERAWERTPRVAIAWGRLPLRGLTQRVLDVLDSAIPTDVAIDAWLEARKADLVLLTPLIELGSPQFDILKSARRRGTPTALAVWSWDHLTSKARIRHAPDRVLVWNEIQKQEAMTLHGVAPARLAVTGAQCFDLWFDRRPSRTRAEFCRDMTLDADRPFILYVCSALFRGEPPEAGLVAQWVERVRASDDPLVRTAGILVRPHPQRMYEWDNVTLPAGVSLHGGHPIDQTGRDDYFDALHYAAAIVGLNTSALIEGAIVDRPVLTLLLPEFRGSQLGTLHFRYLVDQSSGFLHTATSLDQHVKQVGDALAGRLPNRNPRFVEHFIRPQGLTQPSTPRFVRAVTDAAAVDARPAGAGLAVAARPLLWAWRASMNRAFVRRAMMEAGHAAEEHARDERLDQKRLRVAARDERRRAATAARDERYRAKRKRQRVAQFKTRVRRVLSGAAGGSGSHD